MFIVADHKPNEILNLSTPCNTLRRKLHGTCQRDNTILGKVTYLDIARDTNLFWKAKLLSPG